jgi:hypothetical protein
MGELCWAQAVRDQVGMLAQPELAPSMWTTTA